MASVRHLEFKFKLWRIENVCLSIYLSISVLIYSLVLTYVMYMTCNVYVQCWFSFQASRSLSKGNAERPKYPSTLREATNIKAGTNGITT